MLRFIVAYMAAIWFYMSDGKVLLLMKACPMQ